MFEYLMPALVMRVVSLHRCSTRRIEGAVRRQIAYGAERGVPWGVSESAYNVRDRHHTYQYRAFGVPGPRAQARARPGPRVAPYASALALAGRPAAARSPTSPTLEQHGRARPLRLPRRARLHPARPGPPLRHRPHLHGAPHRHEPRRADQRCSSAGIWQRRFHADPLVRSAELLLHERDPAPAGAAGQPQRRPARRGAARARTWSSPPCASSTRRTRRSRTSRCSATCPYTIMISHCGGGYSRYEDLAVTRWRADGTPRRHRPVLLREGRRQRPRLVRGAPAGVRAPPTGTTPCSPPTASPSSAPTATIETRTEIAVVPEDSAEVRRVTVTNNGDETREIELTSYGEIVLAPPDADRAHPAFAQSVRRDRVARLVHRDHRHPPSALRDRAAAVVRARGGHRQRSASAR